VRWARRSFIALVHVSIGSLPAPRLAKQQPGDLWPMQLDLGNEEARALLRLRIDAIEADRYPLLPRIQLLRGIRAKL
jgi:hypothetical protein